MSLPSSMGRAILDANLAHKTANFDGLAMSILRDAWSGVKADREAALRLLSEAAALFRRYEAYHRANARMTSPYNEGTQRDLAEKIERNAEIAGRIEAFLGDAAASQMMGDE